MWVVICLVIFIAAACIVRSQYERKQLSVEWYTVTSGKLLQKERRFVFLSDLHNNEFGSGNVRLLEEVKKTRPDFVLIGGDMMICKGSKDVEEALKLVKNIAEHYPVYYSHGNHESRMIRERGIYGNQYEEYRKELESCGVRFLKNESCCIDEDIRLWGIDLEEGYYHRFHNDLLEAQDIEAHLGKTDNRIFNILLIHSPLFFDACAGWGADLSLAGHFHGGTIRIPFLGGLMTPQFQFFVPWCSGLFTAADKKMIVSRGLGTHSINIRLNNKPQLIAVRLKQN